MAQVYSDVGLIGVSITYISKTAFVWYSCMEERALLTAAYEKSTEAEEAKAVGIRTKVNWIYKPPKHSKK